MTEQFVHPELGSGALREALEDLLNNEACSCRKYLDGKPCSRCQIAIDDARAALSLSSPIEPAGAEQLLNEFIGYISVEYEWRQERREHCQKLAKLFLAAPSRQGAAKRVEG